MRCLILFMLFSIASIHVYADNKSLPNKLIDLTIEHIQTNGPDGDCAFFISYFGDAVWERREEVADATLPYLKDKSPDKVSGALSVLYRLRFYRPMINGLKGIEEPARWEEIDKHMIFFAKLDKAVFENIEHFHALMNEKVLKNLALYLGASPSSESKKNLLRIAKGTQEIAKEQALVCLAWHRDPKDMEVLFEFMLEDSHAARFLPYHFRNFYGEAAIPYLKRTITEAKSGGVRIEAQKEMDILKKQ